jgi:hypothetical protein
MRPRPKLVSRQLIFKTMLFKATVVWLATWSMATRRKRLCLRYCDSRDSCILPDRIAPAPEVNRVPPRLVGRPGQNQCNAVERDDLFVVIGF